MSQCETIVRATVTVLRQHMRLRRGCQSAAVTIAIDSLMIIVSARTGLAVDGKAIRNLVDALVDKGVLQRYPGRRFMASSYAFASPGGAIGAQIDQFLVSYHPQWEPFDADLPPIAALVAYYESLYRSRIGGLSRMPELPEIAENARLNGGLRWLEHKCQQLEQRPPTNHKNR